MMRLLPAALLLLTITASAQPRPSFEVETDKAVYSPGEPIEVTVSISNPTAGLLRYWFHSGTCMVDFELDGERVPVGPCTLIEVPLDIDAGLRWEGIARIYPDTTGYPESGGTHTLRAVPSISGFGHPLPDGYPPEFRLSDATVEFEAPAANAGVVSLSYPAATDTAAFDALRDSLNADVLQTSERLGTRRETWQVSGAPLASIVAEYEDDSRFESFEAAYEYQAVNVTEQRFVTDVETAPESSLSLRTLGNPCRTTCAVELTSPGETASRVLVFDVLGREVADLHIGPLAPGTRTFRLPPWLKSGAYFVRAQTPGARVVTPLVIAR